VAYKSTRIKSDLDARILATIYGNENTTVFKLYNGI